MQVDAFVKAEDLDFHAMIAEFDRDRKRSPLEAMFDETAHLKNIEWSRAVGLGGDKKVKKKMSRFRKAAGKAKRSNSFASSASGATSDKMTGVKP